MEQKLKNYKGGKTYYTPIMNIMINNHSENWYAELGKYIAETLDIEEIPSLNFFANKLKEGRGIIKKIKDFISGETNTYECIGMFFLTSTLDRRALEKMFGKPLLHSEFGEGFKGKYDDETDEYGEPEIKEYYASYFVNVGGKEFHIGYDHRGTGIEIEVPKQDGHEFVRNLVSSDDDAKKCFDSLKKLVDLYKEKVK
jgi:cobyrinic acid a,c-diamide synthase